MLTFPEYNKNIRVVVLTIGISASGKSTWARELVASDPGRWKRVNRDDLRVMLHCGGHDYTSLEHEGMVTAASNGVLRAALDNGRDVVLDNTHLDGKSRKSIHLIAEEYGATVYEVVFECTVEEALRRNALREGIARVPDEVIHKMAKKAHKGLKNKVTSYAHEGGEKIIQDESLPPAVICDLDGTLCLMNGRNPYDAGRCGEDLVNKPVAWTIARFDDDHEIIFMSGRSDKYRAETARWLDDKLGFGGWHLYMRAEGDMRKDSIVKRELFDRHVAGKWYVRMVIDDRESVVRMWRSLGLTVFQVAEGKF